MLAFWKEAEIISYGKTVQRLSWDDHKPRCFLNALVGTGVQSGSSKAKWGTQLQAVDALVSGVLFVCLF